MWASGIGPPNLDSLDVWGIGPTGALIVRARAADGLESLWSVDLPRGPARPIPDTRGGVPLIPTSPRGLGIRLALTRPVGDRGRASLTIVRGDVEAQVARLAPPVGPLALGPTWVVGDHAIVAIDRGARRSLEVVDLARARAQLEAIVASRAYARGDLDAAIHHWQAALAADATYGDAAYDLACAHARGGNLDLAERELALAVALDGPRYRLLGRLDPDLAPLRIRPSIKQLLAVPKTED